MKPEKLRREADIVSRLKSNVKQAQIAADTGVSPALITKIKKKYGIQTRQGGRNPDPSKLMNYKGKTVYKSKYANVAVGEFGGAF